MWELQDIRRQAALHGLPFGDAAWERLGWCQGEGNSPSAHRGINSGKRAIKSAKQTIEEEFVEHVWAAFRSRVLVWLTWVSRGRPKMGGRCLAEHQFRVAGLNAFRDGLAYLEGQSIMGRTWEDNLVPSYALLHFLGDSTWAESRIGNRTFAEVAFECIRRTEFSKVPTWDELGRPGDGAEDPFFPSNSIPSCLRRLRVRCAEIRGIDGAAPPLDPFLGNPDESEPRDEPGSGEDQGGEGPQVPKELRGDHSKGDKLEGALADGLGAAAE